jgi:succinate dehydrogenase / fumarate reductase flavoprotein subunit/fumarate reductase flavoprotein subunit
MVQRSALFGYDLANGRVPVCPSAHYVMGGAKIDSDCYTSVHRLFVAGEDSTGVHGSNRLGGNGIADSCVFGRQAGKAMAGFLAAERAHPPVSGEHLDRLVARFTEPFDRSHGPSPVDAKDRLRELNWAKVGIVRYGDKLAEARDDIEAIGQEAETVRLTGGRGYNMAYSDWIALLNMLDVSRMTCHSALARLESRGAHYRYDHPDKDDENWLKNVLIRRGDDGRPEVDFQEVDLKYKTPADLPLPAGQ